MLDKTKLINDAIDILNTLKPQPSRKNKLKIKPTKITMDGVTLTLKSGKSVWKCPGHAKNAWRNQFDYVWETIAMRTNTKHGFGYSTYCILDLTHKQTEVIKEELYQYIVNNVIKFEDA